MPQKACERCIFHVRPYAYFFWNVTNSNTSSFSIFLFQIWSRGFYIFEKSRDQISNRKIEKLEVFEFVTFQKNMHMASREKYIFHMLFGAFHITPRINHKLWFVIYNSDRKCKLGKCYLEWYESTICNMNDCLNKRI